MKIARCGRPNSVVVTLSGRGDKDLDYVIQHYGAGEEFLASRGIVL